MAKPITYTATITAGQRRAILEALIAHTTTLDEMKMEGEDNEWIDTEIEILNSAHFAVRNAFRKKGA